jgi:leucyl-tRNA synthetase
MVHGTSFRDARGKYHPRHDVEERGGRWFTKDGTPVETRREKMSKSKANVTDPSDVCEQYGADSLRLYELFMSPLEDGGDWDPVAVAGCRRFLDRVWRLGTRLSGLTESLMDSPHLERALHSAIRKVTDSVDTLRFNTAIAEMMVFVNEATKADRLPRAWFDAFVRILAPFAPHIGEELWSRLGHRDSVAHAPWPVFDQQKLAAEAMTVAVQVNGRLRGTVELAVDAPETQVLAAARAEPNVERYLVGKTVRKEIYVPGRLVNIVAG